MISGHLPANLEVLLVISHLFRIEESWVLGVMISGHLPANLEVLLVILDNVVA
jgi:hypothetical protein